MSLASAALARNSVGKKLRRLYYGYKWYLIVAMWVIVLVLGYLGFRNYLSAIDQKHTSWDAFYLSLQLFILHPNVEISGLAGWELQIARFLAPAVTAYTTLETLAFTFREQLQMVYLRFLKNHIVICGLGRKALLLSESYRKRGDRVVVIEMDSSNSLLRQCRELGVIVLIGDATNPGLLRQAQVHKAKYLISVCGNDGANAEIAVHARELVSRRKGEALTCLVHIVDPQLCHLLRDQQIQMGKPEIFRLEFFNVFETAARVLFNKYPPFNIGDRAQGIRPHLVVVGVGRMGESLVANAARKWRDSASANGERLRITLVDRYANSKKASLYLRYPQMEGVCELVPVQLDIQSVEFEQADFLINSNKECDVTAIYVCLDNDSNSLAAALSLYYRLKALNIPIHKILIVVRMVHDAGLATLLQGQKNQAKGFARIYSFGLLDHTCTPDLIFGCTYEILARVFHEEYRQNEIKKGITPEKNPSIVSWEGLSENLKELKRKEAEHIPLKLKAVNCDMAVSSDWSVPAFCFSPQEIELLAEMEHARWVRERLAAGWRPGPANPVKKTSPLLVPWSELPEAEKDKDRVSMRNLPLIVAKAGFQIFRLKSEAGE